MTIQASLFDATEEVSGPGALAGRITRTELGDGAWIDLRPGWLAGCDGLFERLRDEVDWHAERRPMYERVVDVPRLLHFVEEGHSLPDPLLLVAKRELDTHYRAELGEPFATAGLCLYRDGRDSVAWHGDRIGRSRTQDTMVAIVSLGATRALSLRPRPDWPHEPGGRTGTLRLALGHGDLLVMGGSCQRTWEHCVPKTRDRIGARISVQFRPRGVR